VVDSLNTVVTDRRVVWTTSDRGSLVAIDSLTGFATAVAAGGTVTLTATVETVQGFPNTDFRSEQVPVQVLARATSTRVTTTTGQAVTNVGLRVGAAQELRFAALDAVGNQLAGRQFRVTSDTPAVATATVGGVVTAVAPGAATITVQPLDAAGNPQGTPGTFTVTVTQ
jgi:uncharacterized protein YjdB